MGKWAFEIWADLFLHNKKAPGPFYPSGYATTAMRQKGFIKKGKETIHILFAKFSIFAKMTMYV